MTIALAPYEDSDIDLLYRLNTPEMTAYLGGPESDEKIHTRHERCVRLAAEGVCGINKILVDGVVAGGVNYWLDEEWYEIGWAVSPEFQRHGVAASGVVSPLTKHAASTSSGGCTLSRAPRISRRTVSAAPPASRCSERRTSSIRPAIRCTPMTGLSTSTREPHGRGVRCTTPTGHALRRSLLFGSVTNARTGWTPRTGSAGSTRSPVPSEAGGVWIAPVRDYFSGIVVASTKLV